MRKIPVLVIIAIVLLVACNSSDTQKKAIDAKEKALMEQTKSGKVDTTGINELLKSYLAFADAFPSDTNGANYLFKAADFYRYMHQPLRSVELYSKIYNNYPSIPKRPYALFLQGFIYENDARNLDSAKVKYQQFLAIYPNHPISHDVSITLANLGKSPEQMMMEIQSRLKADSLQQSGK